MATGRRHQRLTHGPALGLLLLLGNVLQMRGWVSPPPSPPPTPLLCPRLTSLAALPNRSAHAGSAFVLKLPPILHHHHHRYPAPPGSVWRYQLSLADRGGPLPRWVVFRPGANSLAGLALTEDRGVYHVKVSVTGGPCRSDHRHFYMHILNDAVNSMRQHCSGEEASIWAGLSFQFTPASLGASQRVGLIGTMAQYLHLTPGSLYLFSATKPLDLRWKNLRVCRQGGHTSWTRTSSSGSGGDAPAIEVLWRVGCRGADGESDLAKVLEHAMEAGFIDEMVGAPVVRWRVLCGDGGAPRRKVRKRGLTGPRGTPTPHPAVSPPTHKGEHSVLSPPLHWVRSDLPTHSPGFLTATVVPSFDRVGTPRGATPSMDLDEGGEGFSQSPRSSLTCSDHLLSSHLGDHPFLPEQHTQTLSFKSENVVSSSPSLKTQTSAHFFPTKQTTLHPSSEQSDAFLDPQITVTSTLQASFYLMPISKPLLSTFFHSTFSALSIDPDAVSAASVWEDLKPRLGNAETVLANTNTEVRLGYDTELHAVPLIGSTALMHSLHLEPAAVNDSSPARDSKNPSSSSPKPFPSSLPPSSESTSTPTSTFHPEPAENTQTSGGSSSLPPRSPRPKQPPPQQQQQTPAPAVTHGSAGVDREALVSGLTRYRCSKEPPSPTGLAGSPCGDSGTPSALGPMSLQRTSYAAEFTWSLASRDRSLTPPLPGRHSRATPLDGLAQEMTSSEPPAATTRRDIDPWPSSPLFPTSLAGQTMTPLTTSTTTTARPLTSEDGYFGRGPADGHSRGPSSPGASTPTVPLSSSLPQSRFQTLGTPLLLTDIGGLTDSVLLTDRENRSIHEQTPVKTSQTFTSVLSGDTGGDATLKTRLREDLRPSTPVLHHNNNTPVVSPGIEPSLHSAMVLFANTKTPGPHSARVTQTSESTVDLSFEFRTVAISSSSSSASGPISPSAVQTKSTVSSASPLLSLESSLAVCGTISLATESMHGRRCTPPLNHTPLLRSETTVIVIISSVFSTLEQENQVEHHWTVFSTQAQTPGETVRTTSHMKTTTPEMYDSKTPSFPAGQGDLPDTITASFTAPAAASLSGLGGARSPSVSRSPSTVLCSPRSTILASIAVCEIGGHTHSSSQIKITYFSTHQYSPSSSSSSSPSQLSVNLDPYTKPTMVHPTSTSTSKPTNLPPKVWHPIPALTATVGFPFHYSIPPDTFLDPEDGAADALSLDMRLLDGPPPHLGSWLALDGLALHGVPLEPDLLFAPRQRLILAARDREGLGDWLAVAVDLRRADVEPCHRFTVTARRSLASVLRRRPLVELLLDKLAAFFGGRHLAVVAVAPGSAAAVVVSWYDRGLCRRRSAARSSEKRCHGDGIRQMWSEMSAADGGVGLAFYRAMLPEFPITGVGPVGYGPDCLMVNPPTVPAPGVSTLADCTTSPNSTILPSHPTGSSPPRQTSATASARPTDGRHLMAAMVTALLVVCLLILVLLLFFAALYCYKACRRRSSSSSSRVVAIWPAGHVSRSPFHDADRKAVRPGPPRLLHHERPQRPPAPLWIRLEDSRDLVPRGKDEM